MAQYFQGILGPFQGVVGPVVGYMWRDRWCMRARPRHYHDRQSDAQLAQRSRFKAMILFASPATPVLRIGLHQQAQHEAITEGNVFLRLNKECFSGDGVDYARLQFSQGHLPGVRVTECAVSEAGVATLRWSKEGGRNEDRVHFYAYCPACGTGLPVATAERGRKRAQFVLPQEFAGEEVHFWLFAEGKGGEVSGTAYARPEAGSEFGLVGLENDEGTSADGEAVADGFVEGPLPPLLQAAPAEGPPKTLARDRDVGGKRED